MLADLFDVRSMSLDVPDHVLEDEPGLELVPCPECDGQGWIECYGSAWGASCEAWGRPDLNFTLKPCSRCNNEGEVLAVAEPDSPTLLEPMLQRFLDLPAAPAGAECERCQDTGWIGAEPTAKTRAAGFKYLLGVGICPCGAWRREAVAA